MIVKALTRGISLFKVRNTTCFFMDLRSAMSPGNRRVCSKALAAYPAFLCWKSYIEASVGNGASSSTKGGLQAGARLWWSHPLSIIGPSLVVGVWAVLAALAPFRGSISLERNPFTSSITSFSFCSRFLFLSFGSARGTWLGWGVRGLVWIVFSSVLPPACDSSRSKRLDLVFHCSTMVFGIERDFFVWLALAKGRSPKSPEGTLGDWNWLNLEVVLRTRNFNHFLFFFFFFFDGCLGRGYFFLGCT